MVTAADILRRVLIGGLAYSQSKVSLVFVRELVRTRQGTRRERHGISSLLVRFYKNSLRSVEKMLLDFAKGYLGKIVERCDVGADPGVVWGKRQQSPINS
jgi:hypothetical protein